MDACGGVGGDVESVAVVFADGSFGGVQFCGRQAVPVLYEDDVSELLFTAGFEEGVVTVGRGNGNNQVCTAGDFVEAGVGGKPGYGVVARVYGCLLYTSDAADDCSIV